MAILIDGYNLMHAAGLAKRSFGPGGLRKARQGLLGLLAASLDKREIDGTTVVFDAKDHPVGAPDIMQYKGLTICFATSHEDADAQIEELIQTDSAPRRLLVVSSDHRLQRAARRRRAQSIDSEQFVEDLIVRRRRRKSGSSVEPNTKRHGAVSKAETAYWLEEFKDMIDDPALKDLSPDWYEEEETS